MGFYKDLVLATASYSQVLGFWPPMKCHNPDIRHEWLVYGRLALVLSC